MSSFGGFSSAPLLLSTGEPQSTVFRLLLFLFTLNLLVASSSFITLHIWMLTIPKFISPVCISPLNSSFITTIAYLASVVGMINKHLKLYMSKNEFLISPQNMCQSQSLSSHLMDPSSFLLLRLNLVVLLGCPIFPKLTCYPVVNPAA